MSRKKGIRNGLLTGVIATAVALSFGTNHAFAEESTTPTQDPQVVQDQTAVTNTEATQTTGDQTTVDHATDQTNADSTSSGTTGSETTTQTSDQTNADKGTNTTTDAVAPADAPSLLPGDFFYFLKTMVEKIQLALTFNDVDQAKLLADFANERAAEANVLLDQGQIELAQQTIQQALDQQEQALNTYDDSQQSVGTATSTDESSETDGVNGGAEVDPVRAELAAKFSSNIFALQAVLDKIDNPKAKEALAKNIAKAQDKLEKKLNKKVANLPSHDTGEAIATENEVNDQVTSDDNGQEQVAPVQAAADVSADKETEDKTTSIEQQPLDSKDISTTPQTNQEQRREAAKPQEVKNVQVQVQQPTAEKVKDSTLVAPEKGKKQAGQPESQQEKKQVNESKSVKDIKNK